MKKMKKSTIFLLIVLVAYLVVAIFNFSLAKEALWSFWLMLIRIIPILLIVFVAMTLVNLYFTQERVQKYLGKESKLKGWIYSIISGILISGSPYILFPMLADLRKKGMRNAFLATFLYTRSVKIPLIPVMIFYFGLSFSVILSLYIILFSIPNGFLVSKLQPKSKS